VSFILKDTSSIQEDPDPDPDRSPRPTVSIRIDCGGRATAASTAVAGRIDKPLKTGCIGINSSIQLCGISLGFHSLDLHIDRLI